MKQIPPFVPWQSAFHLDSLHRAWTTVRAARGRGGADGETVAEFERSLDRNLQELQDELLHGRYKPHPVTQILVPKPGSKWRPLTLWTVRDKVVQRAVYNYLEPVFEARFLDCSYGFRTGRSTAGAAQSVRQARDEGAVWVLDADIKDCFGSMRSKLVMRRLARWRTPRPIRTLVNQWLKARIWNAWKGSPRSAGTSQGGVISPLLCNLYLHPFDQALQKKNVQLVRFADDFIILARRRQTLRWAEQLAKWKLKQLGLEIHPQKTRTTSFEEGFQFIGWFFIRDEMYQLK